MDSSHPFINPVDGGDARAALIRDRAPAPRRAKQPVARRTAVDDDDDALRGAAGHAAHFLSRLDRVSVQDTALALSLYNDVPLLAEILRRSRLPEGASRVAIALADGGRGPHIVVTRDARFVTCLGAGMSTKSLPIIAREELDAIAQHVEGLRKKLGACLASKRSGVSFRAIFEPVFSAGPAMSREDFDRAAVWMPIVGGSVLVILADMAQSHARLSRRLHHVQRYTARRERLLRAYWNNMWAMGHLVALITTDARFVCETLDRVADDHPEMANAVLAILVNVAKAGPVGIFLRVVCFAAHAGEGVSARFKQLLLSALRTDELLISFAALGGIAHRHHRLAAEIRKAFAADALRRPACANLPPDKKDSVVDLVNGDLDRLREKTHAALRDPDAATQRTLQRGGVLALAIGGLLGESRRPYAFESHADVPPELALPLFASWFRNPMANPGVVLDAIPLAAKSDPRDFYLPARFARRSQPLTRPEKVLDVLAEARLLLPLPAPDPRIGRNEPCPCGSGRKHKRCCAALPR